MGWMGWDGMGYIYDLLTGRDGGGWHGFVFCGGGEEVVFWLVGWWVCGFVRGVGG